MKITPQQWIEVVKLISTFIIGLITALCVQSCTASMVHVFGKTVIPVKKVSRLIVSLSILLVFMFNLIFKL